MRHTQINSEVIVIVDGKSHKGKIVEAISQGAARIELGDKSTVQASHSLTGAEGTFHYPDEAKAVKEAAKTHPQPDAAAPAKNDSEKK